MEAYSERIDGSSDNEPQIFRFLDELYNETEVIEMLDELLLLKVEELVSYTKASKEKE